jgi:hypothetical protein
MAAVETTMLMVETTLTKQVNEEGETTTRNAANEATRSAANVERGEGISIKYSNILTSSIRIYAWILQIGKYCLNHIWFRCIALFIAQYTI